MTPIIRNLTVEHYRSLRHLKIEGLGRVNLITGRNNSGKSSLLETFRILASAASPEVLFDILDFREEETGDSQPSSRASAAESPFDPSSLFYGFPTFSPDEEPITIAASGDHTSMSLSIAMVLSVESRETMQAVRTMREQAEVYGQEPGIPALAIEIDGVKRVQTLETIQFAARNRGFRSLMPNDSRKVPCLFVSAYGGEETDALGELWDEIALSDLEHHVVDALKIIDPTIGAVSMVGGARSRRIRKAIVRGGNFARPVPMRSFGDGMNRVFGIGLSLVNAQDGLLLIDEFENGLHHTVQFEVWRAIFKLAKQLNVQVFATTHSWDTIEAFQKAASETPDDGVLVRLGRKGEDILATVFSEDHLRIVTRDRIEVR